MGKNITMEQMMDFAQRADERLDRLEGGLVAAVASASVSVPVSAWVTCTDTGMVKAGFAVQADAAVAGLTQENYLDASPGSSASMESAAACGMAGVSAPGSGTLRLFAVKKPAAALSVLVRMLRAQTK